MFARWHHSRQRNVYYIAVQLFLFRRSGQVHKSDGPTVLSVKHKVFKARYVLIALGQVTPLFREPQVACA